MTVRRNLVPDVALSFSTQSVGRCLPFLINLLIPINGLLQIGVDPLRRSLFIAGAKAAIQRFRVVMQSFNAIKPAKAHPKRNDRRFK